MGGSDHGYYFFGFSSDRRYPQSKKKKNDLNLVETRYVHFARLLHRLLFLREQTKSTAIPRIGKFYRWLPPNTT